MVKGATATIPVRLGGNSHAVLIGSGILPLLPARLRALGLGPDVVVVTNPRVARLHGGTLVSILVRAGFSARVFLVPDSEASKSATEAFRLIGRIARYAADKKPLVLALGGGVTGDLAGFVAAVYKRGVPFVQVPTTLLAQVDSSIGGKVAVDLPEGKNLVGVFWQPRLVWADVDVLATLPARQIRNGLAEVVKYGVIRDPALFAFLEVQAEALLARSPGALAHVVARCAAIKARIVERDERETRGIRTVLNFGHTVGHAIETAAGYERYQHGEAVALGMRAACALSVDSGVMTPAASARVNALVSALGLPERVQGVSRARVLAAMAFDKKFLGKRNRFVLAAGIGRTVLREGVPAQAVCRALAAVGL